MKRAGGRAGWPVPPTARGARLGTAGQAARGGPSVKVDIIPENLVERVALALVLVPAPAIEAWLPVAGWQREAGLVPPAARDQAG
jgi:hypothetical protein